jgi:1-acyl-sn-glycerol-3-phosphate acyltransferase
MRRSSLRVLADAYRLWMSILGWGGFAAICIVWGVVIVPPTLLLHRFRPGVRDRFGSLTRSLLRLYLRSLLFVRFEVDGIEGRLRGPRIVVANHQSFLDPILMIGLEPGLGGPIRSYIYRVPVLGTIVRLAGFYPFDVGELPSLEQLHRSAEEARERGRGLLFFPEGTRTRTGEVGPFHRGAFRAAVDHDLPLQPVVIEGFDRVLPPGKLLPQQLHRFPVRVRYLEPVEPPYGDGVRRDVVRALAGRVRSLLVDELERLRSERREAHG